MLLKLNSMMVLQLLFTDKLGSPFINPLNSKIKNLNSHLLPLFISYRSSGEKLIKYQANRPFALNKRSCDIVFMKMKDI